MKEYEIKKRVRAKNIQDALKKEHKAEIEWIVEVEDDPEYYNGKIYGFREKK